MNSYITHLNTLIEKVANHVSIKSACPKKTVIYCKLSFTCFKIIVKNFLMCTMLQDIRKLKTIAKRILNIIIIVLSLSGLIYQVQIIYEQYMSGKTIISLQIGQIPNESPPAVTICYVELYSIERAAYYYPGLTALNRIYKKIPMDNFPDKVKFYETSFLNHINAYLKKYGLGINDLFDKLSIKYKDLNGNRTIKLNFSGILQNQSQIDEYKLYLTLIIFILVNQLSL